MTHLWLEGTLAVLMCWALVMPFAALAADAERPRAPNPGRPSPGIPATQPDRWIMVDDIDSWRVELFAGNATNRLFIQGPRLEVPSQGQIVFDSVGNGYVSCGTFISMIQADGAVRLMAGTPGLAGSSDGPPWKASFSGAGSIVLVADDLIYVVDGVACVLRKLERQLDGQWHTSTVAGVAGRYGHRDGPAYQALFHSPFEGLAVDGGGTIYLMDGDWLRKLDKGVVTTLNAGTGYTNGPLAQARFQRSMGSGGNCMAFDKGGALYISDRRNMAVRKVDLSRGEVTTIAGREPGAPGGGPFDHDDALAARFHPGGGPCSLFYNPNDDSLLVKSADENGFRCIARGSMRTFGLQGKAVTGPARECNYGVPCGVDRDGNIYLTGRDNCVRVMKKVKG